MKTLIYDLEILKCIPSKGARFDGYEYCEGWRDFENMGISACAYGWLDSEDVSVFDWADLPERQGFLNAIAAAEIISGSNSLAFDDQLLAANGVQARTGYDILLEARLVAYGSTSWEDQPEGYSYKLDSITQANGLKKTGSGTLAPQWWQDSRRDEVLAYCKNDVIIERATLRSLLAGTLIDPNTGEPLKGRPLGRYVYVS